tara:strand:+ start:160 stop:693 length:534 start_codon:yes stop_codon:yes gene_type:complete
MSLELKTNLLSEGYRNEIYNWIHNSEYLDNKSTLRSFSVTFKKDEVPDFLKHFITGNYNVYNFIGFFAGETGRIEPHVDTDLFDTVKEKDKSFMIFLPETEVYYVDIDPEMIGGEIVIDETSIKPVTNSSVTIPPNKVHSVNEVKKCKKVRTTLVCEKYKIFKTHIDKLETPWYRVG